MALRQLGVAEANPTDVASKGYVDSLTTPGATVVLSASGTAVVNALTLTTIASGGLITLPSAPADGSVLSVFRASGTGTQTILAGGSDLMLGGSNTSVLMVGMGLTLRYYGFSRTWYQVGLGWNSSGLLPPATAATAASMMSRDASGRAQVSDPSATQDIATKNYVDTKSSPADQVVLASCFR